jgi:hypothetical protein
METKIGFDLRSVAPGPDWSVNRRTSYLLRQDVAAVRSVDSHVWLRPPGLPDPPAGETLWPDLTDLLAAAPALSPGDTATLLITALEEVGDEPTPDSVDPNGPGFEQYDLLGYDVADWPMLSGLSNCAYTPEEAASLTPTWAPRLNRWHLFDDAQDAAAFAAVTAQRVPAHAPFYGYAIYQLKPQ